MTPTPHESASGGWRALFTTASLAGLLCYGLAVFVPLPEALGLGLAFLIGPFIGLALYSAAHVLAERRPSALLHSAGALGLAAGCMNLAMLAVQQGMFAATIPRARAEAGEGLHAAAAFAWRAVNDAQLSLDVAWDTLVCLAVAMMCLSTIRRGVVAGVWSALGLVIAVGGWMLQLATFPIPPADAGYFDFGPWFALWMFLSWVLIVVSWRRGGTGSPGPE